MCVTYTAGCRPVRPTLLLDLPPPVRTELQGGTRRRLRRILAATDGTPASEGALTLSGLLAQRDGAVVEVLSVLERLGAPVPVHEFVDITGELMAERLSRVIAQAESAFGDWKGWTVTTLPTRAVVGIDCGEAALYAARSTVQLLDVPATVHLVHVRPVEAPHDVGYAPLFERFERELHGSELAHIERRVLRGGKPAERLLAYAGREQADLIAVGSHRPTSLADRLLGGVSWRILRAAHCCVLLSGHAGALAAASPELREVEQ